MYPIYKNRYETISLNIKDENVCIHAVPQCQSPKEFELNFNKITVDKNADYNLLLAHGAVAGIKEFKMNEFNELFIPIQKLKEEFDYIALGHYHQFTKLQENAFYAGSTEHLSFTEANFHKGFLQVDLGHTLTHQFIPLNVRGMIDPSPIDCSALRIDQIIQQMKETIHTINPNGKIIRIRLENIPSHIQRGIDFQQVRDLVKSALHFEIKTTSFKHDASSISQGYTLTSLADEFEKFLATQQYAEKKTLLSLGLHYFNKYEEEKKT